ncbi:MAG TPA: endonuclease/exonuclease/phosphatase family protein [Candidatus Nanoarchaeia archaeon]|nr:endonuclease/exonuclease/phosphatase family protein [Candidatus Nanoarchaeia archaeon]
MGDTKPGNKKHCSRRSFLKKAFFGVAGTAATARLGVWRTYDESIFLSEPGPGYDGDVLKVMSWNVAGWRRRSLPAGEAIGYQQRDISGTFAEALEFIRQEQPHILLTQEDTSGNRGSHFFNAVALLHEEFGHAYYGKLFNYSYFGGLLEGGNYGNAIYSRFPLYDPQMFSFADEISVSPFGNPFTERPELTSLDYPLTFLQDFFVGSKGVVSAGFSWKGRQVFFDNLHLGAGHVDPEREFQFELYINNVFNPTRMRLIGGDFNSPPNSKHHRLYDDGDDHTSDRSIQQAVLRMEELGLEKFVFWPVLGLHDRSFTHGEEYNTFPATDTETLAPRAPERAYDLIFGYAPRRNLEMISYRAMQDVHLSDHAPVIAEFALCNR